MALTGVVSEQDVEVADGDGLSNFLIRFLTGDTLFDRSGEI